MAHTVENAIKQRLSLESDPRGFLTAPQNEGERLRFFSKKGFDLTLGPNAASFLQRVSLHHKQGLYSPPYTDEKVKIIRHHFSTWDRDLTGKEWTKTWQELKTQYNLTDNQVTNLQLELLSAYRFKVISQISLSSQKSLTKKEREELLSIHDYLQTLNKLVSNKSLNRTRSASELFSHTQSTLRKKTTPYLVELIKAIKSKNYNEFGVAFENMKPLIEKLGSGAAKYVIDKLSNESDFLLVLPRLIESSTAFKEIFSNHPNAKTMLEQSIIVVKNANYRNKHNLIDKMIGRKHTETQKGHILLLEHLSTNLPAKSAKSIRTVPPTKSGHWLALRPSHELLQSEQPETTKPVIGRRKSP